MINVTLCPLKPDDREQFIRDNQEAFNYGALEEFGRRDDHFEKDNLNSKTLITINDNSEKLKNIKIVFLLFLYFWIMMKIVLINKGFLW